MQASAPVQSALEQHCTPALHVPLQHFEVGFPLASLGPHCESLPHATQLLPWQVSPAAGPVQSAVVQQLPAWQPPLQHSWFAPHCDLSVHALHELLEHTFPTPQSLLVQQLPLTHAPEQHSCPAAHCRFELHCPQ